jgi:hypothetical protein
MAVTTRLSRAQWRIINYLNRQTGGVNPWVFSVTDLADLYDAELINFSVAGKPWDLKRQGDHFDLGGQEWPKASRVHVTVKGRKWPQEDLFNVALKAAYGLGCRTGRSRMLHRCMRAAGLDHGGSRETYYALHEQGLIQFWSLSTGKELDAERSRDLPAPSVLVTVTRNGYSVLAVDA